MTQRARARDTTILQVDASGPSCLGRALHGTLRELRQVRLMQLRVTRRIAAWWPHAYDDWAAHAERTARHAELQWREAGVPPWVGAIDSIWWRWAVHLGHLSEKPDDRRLRCGVERGGARPYAVLIRRPDPTRRRLKCGHWCLGRRRWDDAIQKHADSACREEVPRHEVTGDPGAWSALEAGFVARVMRRTPKPSLPRRSGQRLRIRDFVCLRTWQACPTDEKCLKEGRTLNGNQTTARAARGKTNIHRKGIALERRTMGQDGAPRARIENRCHRHLMMRRGRSCLPLQVPRTFPGVPLSGPAPSSAGPNPTVFTGDPPSHFVLLFARFV